jgi:hypothetical protein
VDYSKRLRQRGGIEQRRVPALDQTVRKT